eukprot:COSAG05_NODE_13346_length_433_cov_3.332335_1_plen_91_part_10
MCRKKLATTFLDPKIAKESISVIESCPDRALALCAGIFIRYRSQTGKQPDHACVTTHKPRDQGAPGLQVILIQFSTRELPDRFSFSTQELP